MTPDALFCEDVGAELREEWRVRDLIVDLFAGIGGTSLGVRLACGRDADVAINHWPYAIEIHSRNHATTTHFLEDVWRLDPSIAADPDAVLLLVGSPDCTDHSNAKGSAPRSTGRRSLADVFIWWARIIRPKMIILENVREFRDWGPLFPDDHPNPKLRGRRNPAHKGEEFRRWCREIEAEGYRLEWRILSACDYGAPTTRPRLFVVARRDNVAPAWPAPTHGPGRASPYVPAWTCIDWTRPTRSIFGRKPKKNAPNGLADNTLRRIAMGVDRFVVRSPDPFLLQLSHGGRLYPLVEPFPTLTATPKAGDLMLVAPTLVETGNGERKGQRPRARDIRQPLGTVTASGSQGALVAAFLQRHNHEPGKVPPTSLHDPLPTVCARVNQSLITARLARAPEAPGGRAGLVAAFLATYHTTGGQWGDLFAPCPTVTARESHQLVTVRINDQLWTLDDIGIRMLHSSELARANGFPADYYLKGSESDRITGIGNSVVPQVMEALIRANLEAR